jgi:hypothetical protein
MTPGNGNVVAAFDDRGAARRAIDDLSRHGLPKSHVRLVRAGADHDRARIAELRAEMQEEASGSVAGPGIGLFTPDQAKGAFPGAALGGVFGLAFGIVVGLVWATVVASALSGTGRVLIAASTFAVTGAVIGFVAGGAMNPRLEAKRRPGAMLDEKRMAADATTLVEVNVSDEHEAEIAHEVLEQSGATRVDDV